MPEKLLLSDIKSKSMSLEFEIKFKFNILFDTLFKTVGGSTDITGGGGGTKSGLTTVRSPFT